MKMAVLQSLLEADIVLLPIVIEPYGKFGLIASRFLVGAKIDTPLTFDGSTADRAYKLAISDSAPTALLQRANQGWTAGGSKAPFGRTYHSWFPARLLGAVTFWV